MKTSTLIELLQTHEDNHLEFELEPGVYVSPTFHITEIKNVSIESVDCGGNPDTYKQTIVQLWVNPEEPFRNPWTASKARSIFSRVDSVKPIDKDAEIFFEYGDSSRRTSNYSVEDIHLEDNHMSIRLYAKPTVCKPRENAGQQTACC